MKRLLGVYPWHLLKIYYLWILMPRKCLDGLIRPTIDACECPPSVSFFCCACFCVLKARGTPYHVYPCSPMKSLFHLYIYYSCLSFLFWQINRNKIYYSLISFGCYTISLKMCSTRSAFQRTDGAVLISQKPPTATRRWSWKIWRVQCFPARCWPCWDPPEAARAPSSQPWVGGLVGSYPGA